MSHPEFYRVCADDPKACAMCGHNLFWTIVWGVGEETTGIGSSLGDRDLADDICDLMNMAYDAGVERVHGI